MLHLLPSITFGVLCSDVKESFQSQTCCHDLTKSFTAPQEWCPQSPYYFDPRLCEPTYEMEQVGAHSDPVMGQKGLEVVIAGHLSPMGHNGKAQTCVAVFVEDGWYLFDVGARCSGNLNQFEFEYTKLKGVFLTHYHSDHIVDLPNLKFRHYVSGANKTLDMYAPFSEDNPDVARKLRDGLMLFMAEDVKIREQHHNRFGRNLVNTAASEIALYDYLLPPKGEAKVVLEDGDLVIKSFQVDHSPAYPAVGYRIEYQGRSFVIGGDTKLDGAEYIIGPMRHADVILQDVMDKGIVRAQADFLEANDPLSRLAILFRDTLEYHPSIDDVVTIAKLTNASRILLTHLSPEGPFYTSDKAYGRVLRILSDISPEVAAKTSFAIEGLRILLPPYSDEIDVSDHGYTPWNEFCFGTPLGESIVTNSPDL